MQDIIIKDLVSGIRNVTSGKLISIILYGSVAHVTATSESDVDVAIVLNGKMNKQMEDALSDVIVDLNLKYDRVFSVVDIDYNELKQWSRALPYFQNVQNEGIVLWKAA